MNSFWDLFSSVNFYVTIIALATPIIFASMAALISNKAGIVNISIEGTMLVSALVGAIFSTLFSSAIMGILFALVAGVLMGYLFAFSTIKLKTNEILVGIAINILAAGLVVFIIYALTGNKSDYSSVPLKTISIPLLRDIPIIGKIFFDSLNLLVYLAIVVIIAMSFFLKKTVLGVRIRSVGMNAKAVDSIGVSSEKVKLIALLIAGGLAGLGGAYMSIGFMSSFNTGMIAGRGFIGLAAEAIGAGIPYVTALFAVVFGLVNAFSLTAQTITGINIPYELLNTLPYFVTIIGLVIFAVIKKRRNKNNI
ncbi:MAG: ABC transporter permease [Tenericutes bacterium HGW-Tenericutes-5]|jgi:simple sugar transport system permease protein|nr:MAG: ABC transporter permease [Tenericutes bacterium HGW-Tenericutes-5]